MTLQTIQLTEYSTESRPRGNIPEAVGELLWRTYSKQVEVGFPSPATDYQWELTSKGWVGYIPVTPELGISLRPRVELGNLFGMLEYAHRLKDLFLEDLTACQSLAEFYERLANVLAKRVLDRARKGFYRAYLDQSDRLPYIRGRVDLNRAVCAPWRVKLECHYQEHTADIEENQILFWTLSRIAQSGICTERVLPTVRKAYRALLGFAMLRPYGPDDCYGRLYNRLNEDYHPLHALCRFFLEHSGPSHQMGDRTMLPFLVHMPRLYELFVAEWLKAHLPPGLVLKAKERVSIGAQNQISFEIDLTLSDAATGAAAIVLDTKYKIGDRPVSDDVAQVVAYAEAKRCRDAVLVYPAPVAIPLDEHVGDIRVRSATFAIDGDLEEAGRRFLRQLLVA